MKFFLVIMAFAGWFALTAQFCININSGLATPTELVIRYFSYFTILTNLLVALCCSAIVLFPNSTAGVFFSRQSNLTAITVYILVVGIIYNLFLRFNWHPQGLQRIVDELLHAVIPVLFLLYWFLFVNKNQLQWHSYWPWLIYPFVYVLFIFIRGCLSGFYPYPFLDASKIGFNRALINSGGVAVVFIVLSLIFIAIGKWTAKNKSVAVPE